MEIVSTLLEIVKYHIPAAIVYFLMNRFLNGQQIIEQLKLRLEQTNDTLPLRFQAYERLILFLERIKISSLVMRLKTPSTGADDLKNALMIAIQKEFEHNLTQQIYISEELWQIIELARDSTLNFIGEIYKKESTDVEGFADLLILGNTEHLAPILSNAQSAVKKEVELYFK